MLHAIHLLVHAWDAMSASTIRNWFQKDGFTDRDNTTYHEECFPNFKDVPKEKFDPWLTVYDDVLTVDILKEEGICADIL